MNIKSALLLMLYDIIMESEALNYDHQIPHPIPTPSSSRDQLTSIVLYKVDSHVLRHKL